MIHQDLGLSLFAVLFFLKPVEAREPAAPPAIQQIGSGTLTAGRNILTKPNLKEHCFAQGKEGAPSETNSQLPYCCILFEREEPTGVQLSRDLKIPFGIVKFAPMTEQKLVFSAAQLARSTKHALTGPTAHKLMEQSLTAALLSTGAGLTGLPGVVVGQSAAKSIMSLVPESKGAACQGTACYREVKEVVLGYQAVFPVTDPSLGIAQLSCFVPKNDANPSGLTLPRLQELWAAGGSPPYFSLEAELAKPRVLGGGSASSSESTPASSSNESRH